MSVDCTHEQCRNGYECQLADYLERQIDTFGLDVVLDAIREICYAKANHIAVEWQDVGLAKLWLAKGIRVNQAAQGVRI